MIPRPVAARLLAIAAALIATPAVAEPPVESSSARFAAGDIVLRHANGRWSNLLRDASPVERRFSHVGVVGLDDAGWHVIHADADDITGVGRVRQEALAAFLADATDWAVYRLQESEPVRTCIASEARRFLGAPFDAKFDLADSTRVYCTELVYHAVQRATGRELVPASVRGDCRIVFLDSCHRGASFTLIAEAPHAATP